MRIDELCQISLKQQGDNEVTKIEIDISEWKTEYPNGLFSIVAKRPNENELYVANTTIDGNTLIWAVTSYDTYYSGYGTMQIVMSQTSGEKKYSQIVLTNILESQQGTVSPTPPQPVPTWIGEVLEKAQQILDAEVQRFYIDDNGHLIVEKVDGEIVDLGLVKDISREEVIALINTAISPISDRLATAENNIDTLANGLGQAEQTIQELDNAKLDKTSVVNDYSTEQDEVYSSAYANSNFAPLGLTQPLFAVKDDSVTDTPTANLELTAPTPSNDNVLQATLQQKGVYDWTNPDFVFIRKLAQNVSLSPNTEYRLGIAFIMSQTTDINFGVKMKVSTDNGANWTYISNNLSFGSQTYVAEQGNTANLIATPNALPSTTNYPQGALIGFEIFVYQNDHNTVQMTVHCGVMVREAVVNTTVEFGMRSLSINTEQIEDGAVTESKLSQELANKVNDKYTKTEADNLFNGKQDINLYGANAPTTTTVGKIGQLYIATNTNIIYRLANIVDHNYTWVSLGQDLSNYYTKTEVNNLLAERQIKDLFGVGLPTVQGVERQIYYDISTTPITQYRHNGTNWVLVGITKSQIGLENVDNTSDLDKPISTAQQNALNGKVDKVTGKGLSTNDFTNEYKQKVDNVSVMYVSNSLLGA